MIRSVLCTLIYQNAFLAVFVDFKTFYMRAGRTRPTTFSILSAPINGSYPEVSQ